MTFGKWAVTYAAAAATFLAIDLVWLGTVASKVYRDRIGGLLLESFNGAAAGIFYLAFIVGILVFGVQAGLRDDSVWSATRHSALFGGLAYATYDLTNLATLKGWSAQLAVIDIIWGTVLSAAAGTVAYLVARALA